MINGCWFGWLTGQILLIVGLQNWVDRTGFITAAVVLYRFEPACGLAPLAVSVSFMWFLHNVSHVEMVTGNCAPSATDAQQSMPCSWLHMHCP